ncbi:restriction endonuclease subunit S [Streptococcus dysgalactiae]|uniref:restriction endonuclease subunit S n=1 Tax=Streptococcus dysgalactiae TaxID=1334 RepID=UPI0024B6E284|nr:restriction endonuclease subunit S [Streptococcus dysgalactiae]
MTKEKIPDFRFSGYTDAWEERKLGEVAERYDNLRVPITAKNRISGDTPYYGANGIQDYVQGYTHDGDFLLIAEDGASDLKNYPVQHVFGKVWVNNHAHVISGKEFIADNLFLLQSIKALNIEPFLVGGGRAKLNSDIMMNLIIALPSLPEQESIGTFFHQLDDLLTLHQRQLDLLKEHKKTYLRLLFPAKGQKVPALRFDSFEGDWEEKKLGEVAEITMGQSPSSTNYTANPSDYILVQGNADLKNGYVFPRVWTTQITKTADAGDLIISVRAPVGDVAKTAFDVVLGRGVAGIKGNEFLFKTLSKLKNDGYWKRLSTGSTFESINSDDIKSTIIQIPTLPEQEAIGNFFSTLDEEIVQVESKLASIKDMKATLLRKLFV